MKKYTFSFFKKICITGIFFLVREKNVMLYIVIYKFLHIRHVVFHTLSDRNKLVAHFLSELTSKFKFGNRSDKIAPS